MDILHMFALIGIDGMEDRILMTVEFEWLYPEFSAELQIEGRGRLDPDPLQVNFAEGMPAEEIAAVHLSQAGGVEMVLHVGKADSRGDTYCSATSRQ